MKRMDAMQLSINLKSIKNAWFYTVVFLTLWSSYELWNSYKVTHNRILNIPLFLLITQNLIYAGSNYFLTRRMNKNEK